MTQRRQPVRPSGRTPRHRLRPPLSATVRQRAPLTSRWHRRRRPSRSEERKGLWPAL